MTAPTMDPHVGDDVLVRVLDDQASELERSHARPHLDTCDVCRTRLDTLERRTRSLHAVLRAADPPMPAMRPPLPGAHRSRHIPRAWLSAAALAALLAGGTLVASPAGVRLLDWIAATLGSTAPVDPPAEPVSSGIEFVPAGGELVIEVIDGRAGGEVRLQTHSGSSVTARVRDASGPVELVVLASGLRIGNSGTRATYEITLPEQLRRVRVQIGAEPAVDIPTGQLPRVIRFGP